MSGTRKFFKDVVFYAGSNLFANILSFITGIVVRRLLAPALMGLFNELMLLFDYGRYSQLGIIDSLEKELPYFRGKKDPKKVELIRDTGFTLCLIIAAGMGMCLFIFSFFLKHTGDMLLVNGVRIVSFMIVLQLISSLYIVLNRSRNNFSTISRYTLLIAVSDVAAKIFLVWRFGLYGLLWASVLTWLLGIVYFYKASPEKFGFTLNFPFAEAVNLFKVGFPIFITGFVFMTLRNIDRIMIIKLLDRESLGFYTIALMVSVYVVQLPNLVYAVVFPRFYQAYGEKQDIHNVKELFVKPTMVFACLFPVLIGLVIIALPILVKYILPAYMPGLLPAYLLLLGSSFLALTNMPGYLLIALNKQAYMIIIGAAGILIGAVLNYAFVRHFGLGLVGIAIGTSISFFIYTTILLSFSYAHYAREFLAQLKFFCRLYLPLLWAALVLILLGAFSFRATSSFGHDALACCFKAIIFIVSSIPLFIYADRHTAVVTLIMKSYFGKKGNLKAIK